MSDYIMEHLKPNGRAGIIVPEGIIFQTGNAYKTLKKKLIEDCLVGVISLPAGVFQPYSGVKTSILVLDKKLNREIDFVFFAKVKNDGFSLSSQRTPINKNDLPSITEQVARFYHKETTELLLVKRDEIRKTNFKLSSGQYETVTSQNSQYPIVKLKDVVVGKPVYGSGAKKAFFDGKVRYIRITDITDNGELKINDSVSPSVVEEKYFLDDRDILIARSGSVGRSYLHRDNGKICQYAGYLIKFPLNKNLIIPEYLFYITKSEEYFQWIGRHKKDGTISNINAQEYLELSFPLPPIEIQQQIVDELEGYQKIIDGCRQVVENYTPTIDIDPSWDRKKLNSICSLNSKSANPKDLFSEKFIYIDISSVESMTGKIDFSNKLSIHDYPSRARRLFCKNDVLMSSVRPNLKAFAFVDFEVSHHIASTGFMVLSAHEDKLIPKFLFYSLFSEYVQEQIVFKMGKGLYPSINQNNTGELLIFVPSLEIQQEVVEKLDFEQQVILNNKKLIEIYTQKIQDRIGKVWGE